MSEEEALAIAEKFVMRAAARWGIYRDEIAQEIRLGLLLAFREKFNEAKGKWERFASNRVRFLAIDAARRMEIVTRKSSGRRKSVYEVGSLDALCRESSRDDITVIPEPEDNFDDCAEFDWNDALESLESDPEFSVLVYYLCCGTMKEAGAAMGISESRVSQKIMEISRSPEARSRLKYYLGINHVDCLES